MGFCVSGSWVIYVCFWFCVCLKNVGVWFFDCADYVCLCLVLVVFNTGCVVLCFGFVNCLFVFLVLCLFKSCCFLLLQYIQTVIENMFTASSETQPSSAP